MRDGGGRGRILGICNHCLACRVEREKPCRIVRVRKAHNQGHFSLSSSPSSSSLPSSRSQSRQPCSACGSNLRQKGGIYVKSQTITCRMREGGMHAGAVSVHTKTKEGSTVLSPMLLRQPTIERGMKRRRRSRARGNKHAVIAGGGTQPSHVCKVRPERISHAPPISGV